MGVVISTTSTGGTKKFSNYFLSFVSFAYALFQTTTYLRKLLKKYISLMVPVKEVVLENGHFFQFAF
jgi:hypothetical protein